MGEAAFGVIANTKWGEFGPRSNSLRQSLSFPRVRATVKLHMNLTSKLVRLLLARSLAATIGIQCSATQLLIPADVPSEAVRDAGARALSALVQKFAMASPLLLTNWPRRFAVLPLQDDPDKGYFTLQLQNCFTETCSAKGFELYAPRNGSEWEQFLAEIKWDQQNSDAMAVDTVQGFGRIRGIQGLIFGRVVSVTVSEQGDLKVRVSLQAYLVETGRQLWGGEESATVKVSKKLSVLPESKRLVWLASAGLAGLLIALSALRQVRAAARPR
jgi:hypothetical protein